MGGMDETKGIGSERTLEHPATQKEATTDETRDATLNGMVKEAAMRGPTADEIVKPTIKRLAKSGIEEIAVLGDDPEHTGPDHEPRNTLGDAASRGETTTDDDLKEEVEETEDIERRKTPKLTASEDNTSDNDLLTELSESPTHVATPENVTANNSNEHVIIRVKKLLNI